MTTRSLVKCGMIGGILLAGFSAQAEDKVLCIASKNVLVLEADLKTVAFSGDQFEVVNPFQGWNAQKVVTLKGQKVTFIKAQFENRQEEDAENDEGWVRASQVKPKSQCAGYHDDDSEDRIAERVKTTVDASDIKSLTDSACCRFPLATSAQADYRTGMRQFGYRRGGARKHGGADLYHRQFEPVYAVADGKIVRDREAFYGGTAATEVVHEGGFTVRYGELAFNNDKSLSLSRDVKAGQLIGYMKAVKAKSGFLHPMLHFELYSGKASGPLTVKGAGLYSRRSDLMNPTSYLLKWEGKR